MGGGADMRAFSRWLFGLLVVVPDVAIPRGGAFRAALAPVGVFDRRPEGVPALDDLPLARDALCVGEVKPEAGGLAFPVPDLNLRSEPGRLDCAELGLEVWVGRGNDVGRRSGDNGCICALS